MENNSKQISKDKIFAIDGESNHKGTGYFLPIGLFIAGGLFGIFSLIGLFFVLSIDNNTTGIFIFYIVLGLTLSLSMFIISIGILIMILRKRRLQNVVDNIISDAVKYQAIKAQLIYSDKFRGNVEFGHNSYILRYTLGVDSRDSTDIWLTTADVQSLERQGRIKTKTGLTYDCQLDILYNQALDKAIYYLPHSIFTKKKLKFISR